MQSPNFTVNMKADGGVAEIEIYDTIGESFWGESITGKSFREQLKELGDVKKISVRLNSRGGSVWDGNAIYNSLKDHPANVTIHIDSLAASIASVIAMAGDTIKVSENAFVMIHNPTSAVWGDAREMLNTATMLEKIENTAIKLYQARSGRSEEEIREWMNEETWFTADEAVEYGFADEVVKNKQKPSLPASASMTLADFRNPPEAAKTLVAMMAPTKEPPVADEQKPAEETKTLEPVLGTIEETVDPVQEEKKRCKQINALCELAGCPEKAEKLIDADFSVAESKSIVTEFMQKKNAVLEEDGNDESDNKPKPEDGYQAEFAEHKELHAKLGITEDQYVEQRMIEDGHKPAPVLMPVAN